MIKEKVKIDLEDRHIQYILKRDIFLSECEIEVDYDGICFIDGHVLTHNEVNVLLDKWFQGNPNRMVEHGQGLFEIFVAKVENLGKDVDNYFPDEIITDEDKLTSICMSAASIFNPGERLLAIGLSIMMEEKMVDGNMN